MVKGPMRKIKQNEAVGRVVILARMAAEVLPEKIRRNKSLGPGKSSRQREQRLRGPEVGMYLLRWGNKAAPGGWNRGGEG